MDLGLARKTVARPCVAKLQQRFDVASFRCLVIQVDIVIGGQSNISWFIDHLLSLFGSCWEGDIKLFEEGWQALMHG